MKIDLDFTKEKKKLKKLRSHVDNKIDRLKQPPTWQAEKLILAQKIVQNGEKTNQVLLKMDQELQSINFRLETIESQIKKGNAEFMKLVGGNGCQCSANTEK